jgi:predicted secreted hydrolase
VAWRLAIPAAGVDGRVTAVREDALNRLAVRYWEGMVCLEGTASGCGFLELTGYGDAAGRVSPD